MICGSSGPSTMLATDTHCTLDSRHTGDHEMWIDKTLIVSWKTGAELDAQNEHERVQDFADRFGKARYVVPIVIALGSLIAFSAHGCG